MGEEFVEEVLGRIEIKRVNDPRKANKDEALVVFENKQVRDAVKAQAPNLANYREDAGMRLEIPNHLQKDFRLLMNLAYDMKQKSPGLQRNVKYDEDELNLYMDVQIEDKGTWRRIRPEQVKELNLKRKTRRRGPDSFDIDELEGLVGCSSEGEGEGSG